MLKRNDTRVATLLSDQKVTLANARRLVRETIPPNLRSYLLALVCSVMVAGSTAGFAVLTRSMVNRIFVDENLSAAWLVAGAVILVALIKGVATYFMVVFVGEMTKNITAYYQKLQFNKLVSLHLLHLDSQHPSSQVAKIVSCAKASATVVVTMTTNVVRDVLTLVALAAVMIYQEPFMSLFAAIALPIVIFILGWLTLKVKEIAKTEEEFAGAVHSLGAEAIQGIRTVKSYQLEEKTESSFSNAVDILQTRQVKLNRLGALSSPLMETLGGIIVGCFIVYASWQSLDLGRTPGEFMAFIIAFIMAYEPAKRLAGLNVNVQRKMAAVQRMYKLLDRTEREFEVDQSAKALTELRGELAFENVEFRYRRDLTVLNGISFTIRPGERLALVGRSGAGKTTIVNLALRLIVPTQGRVLLDGHDLTELALEDIRRAISLVSQDVFLFDTTIRENIRDGRPDASDADIEEAAAQAHVLEFAKEMPDGLDTKVGPNAVGLSGGQRQRIAIARALLKASPIIIFDEATSALDGESERSILNASLFDSDAHAVIIVAHRLSTIKRADRILLLDDGFLVASGTHGELEAKSDLYRSLFHLGHTYQSQG
ncbi:MAG: ABC transporter ATP-binding protein [Pseudomonadota bacterium]